MIHSIDDHFVISSRCVWRPGAYVDKRAAWEASYCTDEELTALQKVAGTKGFITYAMVKAVRQSRDSC